MRQELFSISVYYRHFVRTCTDQRMAANPGQSCRLTDSPAEETRNGSPSTRPTARGMAFNTSQAMVVTATIVGSWNFNPRPTAAGPGSLRSRFLTGPQLEHWMSTRMEISLLAVKGSA